MAARTTKISPAATIEVSASALAVLVTASFDGNTAARRRGQHALCREIDDARQSAMQSMVDQQFWRTPDRPMSPLNRLSAATSIVVCNSRDGVDHETTWGAFCANNMGGLDLQELPRIAATVARGETYRGGGGANGEWTVRKAP